MSAFLDLLQKKIVIADGAMGTLLQASGLKAGELPEVWNITHPDVLVDIHTRYYNSGSDFVSTNTFGVNRYKLSELPSEYTLDQVLEAGIKNANIARESFVAQGQQKLVILDIGPLGKLLKPLGDVSFDDAYAAFAEVISKADKIGGFDAVLIETMSDTLELKAAVLAAKENCSLPIIASVAFDEKGQLLTGANLRAMVALLEGLRVDAIGMNCGLGPVHMKPLALELAATASVPTIVMPNAGLPRVESGKTVFDIDAAQFAEHVEEMVRAGIRIVGGCCGTTPEHIRQVASRVNAITPVPTNDKGLTLVSSYTHAVKLKLDDSIIVGERINPTGKKRFKQALRDNDIDYILKEGLTQLDNGAHILDVNVGLPEIDERAMLPRVVGELQSVLNLPLQIDTSDTIAMERAMRYYNGKPMVNSVNGKQESMHSVFPLIKKYGGVVVGLTLDENGIPETAEGRIEIAKRIIKTAAEYGIKAKDIVIDVLCMTISSDKNAANVTLSALEYISKELKVNTILGVSNVSFGLPMRERVNSNFYTMALQRGLSSAIINPNAVGMRSAYTSYRALRGLDDNCADYIAFHTSEQAQEQVAAATAAVTQASTTAVQQPSTIGGGELAQAIKRGMCKQAGEIAAELIKTTDSLTIINEQLVPALDEVGSGFERGKVFLPQLLMSADAAKAAFDSIKEYLINNGEKRESRGKVVIATVKGDIHDIGKNIVKVLLENYGFDVIDLGKDVPPEAIVAAVREHKVGLVGLSALMTTTVGAMEETIKQLRAAELPVKVMVGGAVLTQEYADQIGADFYSKDAMGSVRYACTLALT